MSSDVQLFDAAGRRRSPATLSDFHAGRAPANKGQRYAADPPTVDEIIAIMRVARNARYGNRLNGLIVVLWRAGLRINEALSLTETDLEQRRGIDFGQAWKERSSSRGRDGRMGLDGP
jgi:integrase